MRKTDSCRECKIKKSIEKFYKNQSICKKCLSIYEKQRRKKNMVSLKINDKLKYIKNKDRIRERGKTVEGFKARLFDKMQSRTRHKPFYIKRGITLLITRKQFSEWLEQNNDNFMKLYNAWKKYNYDKRRTPSIDRINRYGSYTLTNIELVNLSTNMIRAWTIGE